MYDVIVIGGGPAGLTSALYAARAGKSVLILEKNAFGGQIATAPRVENFPSINEIVGARLADNMFEQAISHGVEFDMGNATVDNAESGFTVTTEYASYFTKSVVLATGVQHKKLPVESAEKYEGKGICYCAVCDGAFYKDKAVCVVGDGNSAAQYALFLAEMCSKVYMLTLLDKLFCDHELVERIVNNEKIEWATNVCVTDVLGDDNHVKGVAYKDEYGAITYVDCDAVFVAIGQQPDNERFSNVVDLDKKGYIIAGEDCKTSCDGIFAVGDCRTKLVRQCATAVGDGAIAGFSAALYVDVVK